MSHMVPVIGKRSRRAVSFSAAVGVPVADAAVPLNVAEVILCVPFLLGLRSPDT